MIAAGTTGLDVVRSGGGEVDKAAFDEAVAATLEDDGDGASLTGFEVLANFVLRSKDGALGGAAEVVSLPPSALSRDGVAWAVGIAGLDRTSGRTSGFAGGAVGRTAGIMSCLDWLGWAAGSTVGTSLAVSCAVWAACATAIALWAFAHTE